MTLVPDQEARNISKRFEARLTNYGKKIDLNPPRHESKTKDASTQSTDYYSIYRSIISNISSSILSMNGII
ncbi:hypothetical protein BpHYR1_043233 [Brachionus plicatilis]|uniref:Uncharacterized protein n=1 Tax=Brachionus plicatilis TaxID=10195 RepID=A0A3M7QDC0_BRAPC|nr:hypothetical protein BpHYR1_043233 [Brachionus plicatilis]